MPEMAWMDTVEAGQSAETFAGGHCPTVSSANGNETMRNQKVKQESKDDDVRDGPEALTGGRRSTGRPTPTLA